MINVRRNQFLPKALMLQKNSAKGYWYDFKNRATLFQDVAGTIPALAAGDTVALVLDMSGNGNHLMQSGGTKRSAVSADGLYYDGIDDCFKTISVVPTGASESATMLYGAEWELSSSNVLQMVVETSSGTGSGLFYVMDNTTANTGKPRSFINGTTSSATTWEPAETPPSKKVASFQGRTTSGNTLNKYIRNGILLGENYPNLGATIPFADNTHYIGARNQSNYFYKGTMTSLIVIYKECTDTEIKAISQFINARMGGIY